MRDDTKRHFLDCRSLAEMAITWVVASVMFILPAALAATVLRFVFELPETHSRLLPFGLSLLSILGMWLWFVRIGRGWREPRLAAKEFFYFQISAAIFVFMLAPGVLWGEAVSPANEIRSFLAALFVMINLAYVTLAWGIHLKLPARILVGLVLNIAVALASVWRH